MGTQPAAGIAESPKYLLTTVTMNVNLRGQAVPSPPPTASMALQKDSTAGLHSGPKRATGRSGSTEGQDRHWWDTGGQQEKGGTKGEMWGGIKWHPPPWV